MLTYEDFSAVQTEEERMHFIRQAVDEHRGTKVYKIAVDAQQYFRHMNPTIMRHEKTVQTYLGKIKQTGRANHKILCRYYYIFIVQEISTLLGNGATFQNEGTKEKLGKKFDGQLSRHAQDALNDGVVFAFWNLDHVEFFNLREFCPMYSEMTGALMAGIRFWQLASDKPKRYTLYTIDGYQEFIEDSDGNMKPMGEMKPYKLKVVKSVAGGEEIVDGENYESFPIVPWYNANRQSELVGGQNTLDAYDLMLSQLTNNVDEGALIYWLLKNANAMTPEDDMRFLQQLYDTRVLHANGDDGIGVEPVKVDAPFEASEKGLERLRKQLFEDFMALDATAIQGGQVTATQIMAAYQNLMAKCDLFEYETIDFIERLLKVVGIDDVVSFPNRQMITNDSETTTMVLSASAYLDDETILNKLPFILPEEIPDILKRTEKEEYDRFQNDDDEGGNENED